MNQHTFHIRMAPSNPLIMIASGTKSREGKKDLGHTNHQQRSDGSGRACSPLRTEPRRRRIHSSGRRGSLRWGSDHQHNNSMRAKKGSVGTHRRCRSISPAQPRGQPLQRRETRNPGSRTRSATLLVPAQQKQGINIPSSKHQRNVALHMSDAVGIRSQGWAGGAPSCEC